MSRPVQIQLNQAVNDLSEASSVQANTHSETKPPYSARDIRLEFLCLPQVYLHKLTAPPVSQYYLQSAFFLSIEIFIPFMLCFVITSQFGMPLYICALSGIFGLLALQSMLAYSRYKQCLNDQFNQTIIPEDTYSLINTALEEILNTLQSTQKVTLQYILEPRIKLVEHRTLKNHPILYIGIPLLAELSNKELYSLITYQLSQAIIIHESRCKRFLKSKHLDVNLSNYSNCYTSIVKRYRDYKSRQTTAAIQDKIYIDAAKLTTQLFTLDIVLNALAIEAQLLNSFALLSNKIKQQDQSLPINAVTQILCLAIDVSKEMSIATQAKKSTHNSHQKQFFKLLKHNLRGSSAHINTPSGETYTLRNYPAYWLVSQDINDYASQLSFEWFKSFGFNIDQLKRTHFNKHQAFKTMASIDLIQYLYQNTYRPNIACVPNMKIGETGSLMVLKTELLDTIQRINSQTQTCQIHLKSWDTIATPYHAKHNQNNEIVGHSIAIEEFITLIEARLGFGLSMTLSMSSPGQQKIIQQLILAAAQTKDIMEFIDHIVLQSFQFVIYAHTDINSESTHARASYLQKSLTQTAQRIHQLPDIFGLHRAINCRFLTDWQTSHTKTSADILQRARDLIFLFEDYHWQVATQLAEQCTKLESRLKIT